MIKFNKFNADTLSYDEVVVGVGTTLYASYESVQVMSDIWEYMNVAYYWDGERISSVASPNEFTIDADFDKILPQVQQWQFDINHKTYSHKAEHKANEIVKNSIVRVTRGKTAVGTEGKVVVVKEMAYGMGYRASMENKIAIALDDEMTTFTGKNGKDYPCHKNVVWAWARNCDVVNPNPDYAWAQNTARIESQRYIDSLKHNCKITVS